MDMLIATSRSYLAVVPLWSTKHISDEDISSYWQLPLHHRPPIMIFGQSISQPRDVGFFSDSSEGYYYSGQLMVSQPLTDPTVRLLSAMNSYLLKNFNGILVNCYHDGDDKIGAHSDNEDGLDKNRKMVAGIAFGAVRNFRIRYKNDSPSDMVVSSSVDKRSHNSTIVADISHEEGMLLVMGGDFQSEFTHEIPAVSTNKVNTARISLTFRQHSR